MFIIIPMVHLINDAETKYIILEKGWFNGIRHLLGIYETKRIKDISDGNISLHDIDADQVQRENIRNSKTKTVSEMSRRLNFSSPSDRHSCLHYNSLPNIRLMEKIYHTNITPAANRRHSI